MFAQTQPQLDRSLLHYVPVTHRLKVYIYQPLKNVKSTFTSHSEFCSNLPATTFKIITLCLKSTSHWLVAGANF